MNLKTNSEIREIVRGLPKDRRRQLMHLISNVFNNGDADSFREIDEQFMYPMRWDIFEHHTDSPILYEDDDVNEFIDACIESFMEREPNRKRI